MSGSNCSFLTCIQISQEAGQVVWYSHLLKNFPQFVVIHTVKGFDIVNKAEVDVFLELSCFFYDPTDVGTLTSGSSAFSKSSLNIWNFMVHVLLKPDLKNFEHCFASVWMELCDILDILWHCLSLRLEWKLTFSSPVATAEFSRFAGIFSVASSFRIWNSSAGIASPPLVLFVVMLPKTHLTLDSRMSGIGWVITPLWLSGSWRSFFYSSSVFSCHLFLISSAFVRPIPFLSFIVPIFALNIPLVSLIFLTTSLVFPILLFSSISLHWSLWKVFLSLLAILWNSAFRWVYLSFSPLPLLLFFSQLFVRPPQTTIFPFCISLSWGSFWSLPPVQCYEPPSIILQALCLTCRQ